MKIFDTHVHLGKKRIIENNTTKADKLPVHLNDNNNTGERFARLAQKQGVFKAVVFPYALLSSDINKANDYILNAYAKNQELMIPFALISPELSERFSQGAPFRGVKEHFYVTGAKDPKVYAPLYDLLQQKGLILLIHPHMKERVEKIRMLKRDFPKLKIILAHSGRKWPFTGIDVADLILPALKGYDDLYFDTSTIRAPQTIADMVNQIGSDRILFGSDYPYSQEGEDIYPSELATVTEAPIADADKEKILFANSKRLFWEGSWIRRSFRSDRETIWALFETLTPQERKFLALDKKLDLIKANIRDERHIYLLEDDRGLAGFLRESGRSDNGAMIEEIIVHRDRRGQRCGERLLQMAEQKFSYLESKTFADNSAVIRLQERLGFQVVKRSPNGKILYWRKDHDAR
ncbi:GNAT family N-acetyltransferase [Heliobacterium gestii]|uniref:GNAT family N-acetyltransferase n=1 Tax=Heliomicrobium gestii TaxID=2699 RepID=A0A845L9P7_HELGE|nr:GNAT family N-acetyltransferase [Heliomicrobium gestii]MBM7865390.1 putative TIM-barrel fold metal-dependent hydrolase/ribosomal protein S18 acetylase RimI-like enzyme [Heliomicrobium gestii]MZP41650.1 GNAT family N-acetyltransferase [Heliomicrobium gestii]